MWSSCSAVCRCLLAFVLVRAALMSGVMCSDAAGARTVRVTTSLFSPRRQLQLLSPGRRAPGGTEEPESRWSAIDGQWRHPQFTEESFASDPTGLSSRRHRGHSQLWYDSKATPSGPFHPRSSSLPGWAITMDAGTSYGPRAPVTSADGQPSLRLPSQTGGSWSSSGGFYGSYRGEQGSSARIHPGAPSVSRRFGDSVIKRNPDKPSTSATRSSQRLFSAKTIETLKNARSYLFTDSSASWTPPFGRETVAGDGAAGSTPSSNKQRVSNKDQNVGFVTRPPTPGLYLTPHTSSPASGRDTPKQRLPSPGRDTPEASGANSLVHTADTSKPPQSTKSIFGFRGFKSFRGPNKDAAAPPSSRTSLIHSADRKYRTSPTKYTFSQRRATAASPSGPEKISPPPASTSSTSVQPRVLGAGTTGRPHDGRLTGSKRIDGRFQPHRSDPVHQAEGASAVESDLEPSPRAGGRSKDPSETREGVNSVPHVYTKIRNFYSKSIRSRDAQKNPPPGTPAVPEPFNTFTSRTVRGQRVGRRKVANPHSNHTGRAAIVRLPKRPEGVKRVDILGGAALGGVGATSQTPVTAEGGVSPNSTDESTAAGRAEETSGNTDNSSRGAEASEDMKTDVGRDERDESDESDGSPPEGSGSLGLDDLTADLSADGRLQALRDDRAKLDYLQTSTGNVSFKSMKLSDDD